MAQARGRSRCSGTHRSAVTIALIANVAVAMSCGRAPATASSNSPSVLRVGWGQVASTTSLLSGVRQLSQNLSVEGLARPGEDGRMLPSLAESWTYASDGRSLTIKLRPNVKFHDGSAADPETVAPLLQAALRSFMGPVFSDIESIRPKGPDSIEILLNE